MRRIAEKLRGNRRAVVFLLVFAFAFVALQQLYLRTRDLTANVLTHTLNAVPAAAIVNAIDPSQGAVADGSRVASPRGGIDIKRGCEGFEVVIILFAALIAYPAPIRWRLAGIAAGMAGIYVVNLVRIVSLYFVFVHAPERFDFAHLFLWQSLIILAAAGYFLLWIHLQQRSSRA
jgi:exosortase family protein XrtM